MDRNRLSSFLYFFFFFFVLSSLSLTVTLKYTPRLIFHALTINCCQQQSPDLIQPLRPSLTAGVSAAFIYYFHDHFPCFCFALSFFTPFPLNLCCSSSSIVFSFLLSSLPPPPPFFFLKVPGPGGAGLCCCYRSCSVFVLFDQQTHACLFMTKCCRWISVGLLLCVDLS